MAQGRSLAQKQELVSALTQQAVRVMGVKAEWVTILIDEYPRENWATSGYLHSIKFGPGFGRQGLKE